MDKPISYKGSAPYIFVSYAHKDSDAVWPIIARMQADGCRVWYDDGIDPGTEWDENIASHVEGCGYFIAFLSPAYLESENCRDELNFARDLGKERLLVYLADVTLPAGMRMRLSRLQAIHWYTYANMDQAYAKLYEAKGLDTCRGKADQTTPEAPAAGDAETLCRKGSEFSENGDDANAFSCYLKAANLDYAPAQNAAGNMYASGRGTPQDKRAALRWYRKAAEQGEVHAQNSLALMYYRGEGTPQNSEEAVQWFQKAARQGSPEAQCNLGLMYANGYGTSQDKAEAVQWFQKAAGQGYAEAQLNLGLMYLRGYGVNKDAQEARRWIQAAADQGDPAAQEALNRYF